MNLKLLKAYLTSSYRLSYYINETLINGTLINSYMLRYVWIWDEIECRLFYQYKNVPEIYKQRFKNYLNRNIIHVKFHFSKADDNVIINTTTFDLYISRKKFKKYCRRYNKQNNDWQTKI